MSALPPAISWCLALALALATASATAAGERTERLDCVAKPRLLDTHFARYGPGAARSILREPKGIRLRLPADPKGAKQIGLYSYVALHGDFEITASYEWIAVPAPKTGYGTGCGIAVEATGDGGTVALARAHLIGKGDGYTVTRGRPEKGAMQYEVTHYPTKARKGQLVLRREKKDLICLASDGGKAPLTELCRVPFTDGTVRQLRIYADPGGSPTSLDARVGQLRIEADKITGGAPLREERGAVGWWIAGALLLAAAGAGGFFYWRRR